MYLRDLGASLLRRWQLLCAALLLTAATCYGVAAWVGPTYAATGGVVLLPPPDPENPDANRFLSLGSLKQATDVLVRSLAADATHRAAQAAVPGADYTVEPDETTSAPVLVVRATGRTPREASAMLEAVMGQVPVSLGRLQNALGIDQRDQIVNEVLATDTAPKYVIKGQLRAAAGAGALVFGALCLVIGGLDSLLLRRREHRAGIRVVHDGPVEAGSVGHPVAAPDAEEGPVPRRRGGNAR